MKTKVHSMRADGRDGLRRSVLAAGIVFGVIGAQSLFAANNYWTGAGANTLVSTAGNWSLGHAMTKGEVPYFGPDATGKTAVFDGKFETDGYVWVNSTSGGQYDPATGAVNPVVWEATKPENGFYSSNGFVVGEAGNGALRIKGGTYVTGASLRSWVGNKCAGYLALEGGTIVCSNEFRMALGSAAACAEVIVGDGDEAGQPALISVGNYFFCVTTVDGTTGRLTVRKGGTVSAHYLYVGSEYTTLVLDGGTLIKVGDFSDSRCKGYFYGYLNHALDKGIKFQITDNGGTINLLEPARFCTPLTLASGATSAKLHKRGPGKLTLDEVGDGIALVIEEGDVVVGSGTLESIEIAGGIHLADVSAYPAHKGKILVSGGRLMVRIDESALADGVPVATGLNVNSFALADGLAIEDILFPEPVIGFEIALSVDETGAVWAVPRTANVLPAGYTALSYIRSTGDQYILTGCELGPDECVEMDYGDVKYAGNTALFGEDAFASKRYLFDMQKKNDVGIFMFHGHSLQLLAVEAKMDYHLTVTDTATTLSRRSGGSTSSYEIENPVESVNRELAIFALNDGTRKSIYSFYRLKVRATSGLLLHSFTPCQNEYGEPGLFDLVDRKFLGKSGTKRFLIPGEASDFKPIDDGGFDSETYGATLDAREGVMTEMPGGITLLRKTTPFPVNASAVKALPAVTVEQGALSVVDGETSAYVVDGTMALAGGARLAVDLTAEGCDTFAPKSVNLSLASAENPVYVIVNAGPGASLEGPLPVIAGGVMHANQEKFKLVCDLPAKLAVNRGALVLVNPDWTPILDSLTIKVH